MRCKYHTVVSDWCPARLLPIFHPVHAFRGEMAARIRRHGGRIRAALALCDVSARARRLAASPSAATLRFLGLDVNTGSTGVAVLDARARVALWRVVPTAQFASADVLAVGAALDAALGDVQRAVEREREREGEGEGEGEQRPPVQWAVGVEAFLRMFRPGQHHNAGMFQLAQLNGIVSFASWRRFGARPRHAHPTAARGLFGLSTASSTPTKLQALEFAQREQPEAARELLQRGARSGKWTDAAFDAADAYVIANYTRCEHLADLLRASTDLQDDFAAAYMDLLGRCKGKPAEMAALETMSGEEQRQHLDGLLHVGVGDWMRSEYAQVLSPSALRNVQA